MTVNSSTFDLTQTALSVPDSRRNLLTPESVESIESSPCLGRPGDLLLGKTCPAELDDRLAWQSEPGPGSIHWITLRLKKAIELDHLILVTLPKRSQDGNRHGIRDCDIELTDEKGNICRFQIRNNEEMLISVPFKACRVRAMKITFGGANIPTGDQVYNSHTRPLYSLMSIRGYRGQRIKAAVKDISLKIATGTSTNVCIFEGRELGGPIPGIDSGKIEKFFLSQGYGVSFITADHLCAIPRNKIPFSLLINLAGKRFPANSWLYQALRETCHLLSVGSLPLSDPWVKVEGTWMRLGFDLGLTATAPDWVQDHATKSPEQLRIDTTRHRTVKDAKAISEIAHSEGLTFDGPFSGHTVTADLGEILSIEQDRELVKRGLWHQANVDARSKTSTRPLMYGVWGHDYNPIYQTPCARLVPLLHAHDSAGFYQGIVAGAVINYAGRYEDSRWGIVEIDNFSHLVPKQKDDLHRWLFELGHRLIAGPWFSFLRTSRYGLFPKDRCEIITHLNGSNTDQAEIAIVLKTQDQVLLHTSLKHNHNSHLRRRSIHIPETFPPGLITVQAIIKDRDRVIDRIETGILIRAKDNHKPVGPNLEHRDNTFSINGHPELLFGARTDGFHQWGQPEQEPLFWNRMLQQMRTMNLKVFSPVHLTFYEADGNLSQTMWDIIETQAQLCQLNDMVFAPCLFFPGATDCIRDRKGSIALAEEFARRLRHIKGFFLYLYDDGLPQDSQTFNAWTGALRKAIHKQRPGTLITAEFVNHPTYHALIKETGKNLDFLAISHHAMTQDVLPNMLVDSTLTGKATTNAEFGVYNPANLIQDGFKYRFNLRLGIAQHQALIVNWMLQDPAHAQFPWGCLYAHDCFQKPTGLIFQAETMLLAGCHPIPPEEPVAAVFIPVNRMRFNQMQAAELSGGDFMMQEKMRMMVRAGIPFRIIHDEDLDLLSSDVKYVIIPRLTDPDEKTQEKLTSLVRKKIQILWQSDGFRPDCELKRELVKKRQAVAIKTGSPAEFAGSIFHHIYGKPWTGDFNQPYVLSRKFKEFTYTLIADLPRTGFSKKTGEILLEGTNIRYEFDEDHLGVLLIRKGKLIGAAGFRRIYVNDSPIVEGPGYTYLLALDGKSLDASECLLIIPHAPGSLKFKGNNKTNTPKYLACPVKFEEGVLHTGSLKSIKAGLVKEIVFHSEDTDRFWLVGSEDQIQKGLTGLLDRLKMSSDRT